MICAAGLPLHAQQQGSAPTVLPEHAQIELAIIGDLLDQSHPDPYRYVSKGDLQRMLNAVADSTQRPVTVQRFAELLLPVFKAVGDANCQLEQESLPPSVRLLPLRVVLADKQLIVVDEPKGFRSIPRGSILRSINGIIADSIVERIGRHIVTDGRNQSLRNAITAAEFPERYYRHVDPSKKFDIVFTDPEGKRQAVHVTGLTVEEVSLSGRPSGVDLAPWRSTLYDDQKAMWLRLTSLEPEEVERNSIRPDKYLRAVLQEMQRNGIRDLVIDVRGTTGRELAMAELVFSAIALEPFRVIQDMSVRSLVPPEHYEHAVPQVEFYSTTSALFLPSGNGSYHVRPDDHRLDLVPPMRKAFKGKVYVVCDGGTRDAAAAFVMLAKRSKRARIVGEEVGTNAGSFTGGRGLDITLPHSGLRFSIPLLRYVPDGMPTGPLDRGEMPHHTVLPLASEIAHGRDAVKTSLLELFKER